MIKENLWSMGDDFKIKDGTGKDVFFVDGKAFSWGDQLSFQDMSGRELAYIKQKMISFKPCYEIYRDNNLFARVVKEFSWFKKEFSIDVPGPNDYTIQGSFWRHDYKFLRAGRVVANVTKETWAWSDSYGIEVEDGEDYISILSAVLVIDQILHDDKD